MFHDARNNTEYETRIIPTMLIYSMIALGGAFGIIGIMVVDQVLRRIRTRYVSRRHM